MKNKLILSACAVFFVLTSNAVAGQDIPSATREKSRIQFFEAQNFTNAPFSEGVRVGDTLFLSGMVAAEKQPNGTMKIVPGGIRAESEFVMNNIKAALEAKGYTMRDVVKCTIMLADITEWPVFNEVYLRFFSKPYPARSAFGTSGLALAARVEVECMAAK